MKKTLFLCFMFYVLCFDSLTAQQSVTITGPTAVEVGIPYNYSFNFVPDYIEHTTLAGVVPDDFIITEWVVTTDSNCYNGQVVGYIGNSTNQSCYYNNSTFNSPSPLTVPIQWGDGTFLRQDNVRVKVSGYYIKKLTGENTGYFRYLSKDLAITTVNRIEVPIIAGNMSVLDCDQTTVNYSVSNITYANKFLWQVTNGAQIIGSATGTTVSVKPPISGDFDVTCIAKRNSSNPNYFKSSSKTITRTARTFSFETNPVQDYICKDSGLVFQYADQSGLSNITWNAPNCSVSAESVVNGMKQVTIYPNSSATIGSSVTISATANFTSGCTAVSSSKSFKVFDSTTPITPAGYFNVTLPENETDVCTATTFDLSFVPTNGFNNGETTFSPLFLWGPGDEIHYKGGKSTIVTVYNKNMCTGVTTSKAFTVYPPAPCASANRLASSSLIISPNPSNGIFKVTLPETLSGNYQIFDQINGVLVQEGKFDNQNELQIELVNILVSGIYILKVITEDNILTEKIILDK